jgi:cytochrome c oxidase assembly protein subunit 11
MFGFGYALVPLYDVLCQVTGLNGKTGRAEAEPRAAVSDRVVTVEFMGNATSGLPWEFRPLTKRLDVRLGETMEVKYYVRNLTQDTITGQAIPSVAPGLVATQFKKIECFCFSQQTLKPGEAREMPVRFVIDPEIDRSVHTITLSYAFFNTDKASAARYGGEANTTAAHADHHHGAHGGPGG